MAQFTLADIVAAAEAKFGSTDIALSDGSVTKLVNPLRLPKLKRDALSAIGERMDDEDVDQAEVFEEAIRLAAETEVQAAKLIAEINGDLAVLAQTFENYTKGTQVGEASASDD